MFSRLKPGFVYSDISSDITENDLDVVADTWDIEGREVYRGTRDPRYTHASVFWLYDDKLERVGCVEHSLDDHADMRVLWFRDSEFGTLLQEDWTVDDDLWSKLPRHVFDRFLNEEWTKPAKFLEHCLQGPMRIVTQRMLVHRLPTMFTCSTCGHKSLRKKEGCSMTPSVLDFPDRSKTYFIDSDFVVHIPPSDSVVWSRLQPHDDGSSERAQEQERAVQLESPPSSEPKSPPAQSHPPHTPAESVQQ
jgi:hypothetical protein